jgi:outer membrane lipoprotein-sorting protein
VKRTAAALVVLALAAPAAALSPELAEVLGCVRRNAPKQALVHEVELVSVDRTGEEVKRAAKLFAKRTGEGFGRVLLRVEEPEDLRGTTFLLAQKSDGTQMYVYLPELGKVKRVTARQVRGKLLGTDFSYEELERLFGTADESGVERLPDVVKDGRPAYALAATAAGADSAYGRVTTLVDRETCVPLEISFFAKDAAAPQKVLSVDPAQITKEGDVHVPRLVRIRDVAKGTESRLVTRSVQIDPDLSDSMFLPAALEKKP